LVSNYQTDAELDAILKYIDSNEAKLYKTVSELVAFSSVNPCDANGIAAQMYMASQMESLGLQVKTFESSPNVLNVIGTSQSNNFVHTLLLLGHIDIVPANIEEWKTPPFQTVISDGKMFGRGTSDMKGSMAGFLMALESIRKVCSKEVGRIIFASVFGEEIGQSGTRFLQNQGVNADFAILGEPSRGRSLHASVGLMNLRITLRDSSRLHLGARRNFIHAGGGLIGANCIEKMSIHIIAGLRELERTWGVVKIHPHMPPGQAMISPYRIEGGDEDWINPSHCSLYVSIFYLPNENEERVKEEIERYIRAIAATDVWLMQHQPICTWYKPAFIPSELPIENDGFRNLCNAYQKITNEKISLGGRGALTDAGWIEAQGIPVVVYGAGDINTAHGNNEFVTLKDLLVFTKTVATFMYYWMRAN